MNPWAYQTHPEQVAHQLAKDLGITFTDNADLIRQLREANPGEMNRATPQAVDYVRLKTFLKLIFNSKNSKTFLLKLQPIPRGHSPIPFVPSRDPENVIPEEAFLPGEPIDLMNAGKFYHVPYITGFNNAESLFNILEDFIDPNVFNVYNANPHIMIPLQWNVSEGSPESVSIVHDISQFYFDGRPLSRDVRYQYTQVKHLETNY